jgi:anti-sigma factor RsiW
MPDCSAIDSLVTPYIDGELADADRQAIADHLRVCAPCHSRVEAERAVHALLRGRKAALTGYCASERLHAQCAKLAAAERPAAPRVGRRLAPLALAASLTLIVGGAFVYRATEASTTIMAAELAADHMKCFMLNAVADPNATPAEVERSLRTKFGWDAHLPAEPHRAGLELVGERTCLYGEGRVAHIMYKRAGRPVSLFMLPDDVREDEVVKVMGHQAAVWSVGNRTFVLLAREPRADVERMASFVHASLR